MWQDALVRRGARAGGMGWEWRSGAELERGGREAAGMSVGVVGWGYGDV